MRSTPYGGLSEFATFSRSLLTSLFTTALDFGTLIGLTEEVGVNYVLATWIGTVVGSLSNFTINKLWAFYAHDVPAVPAMTRFVLVQIGASGLHTGGVWLLTRFAGLPYPTSKLVVAAVVYLVWNYPLNRYFVFGRRKSPPAPDPALGLSLNREEQGRKEP
ncbi:MAG TPA: GtrA family protein [Polyangia bacterium]